jgi:tRNA(Ile)-lysidine synthase
MQDIEVIEKNFSKNMEKFFSIKDDIKIAVAVSGGSDSLALLYLTNAWMGSKGEMAALIVDHGLRPESTLEAYEVSVQLNNDNIKHEILKWENFSTPSSNIQAKARNARYHLLLNWCKNNGYDSLLVAHTLNDQIETFFMNLARGSGLDGLSGIKEKTNINGIDIIRPLLNVEKSDLQKYLICRKINWIQDPSNYNEKFTRVKIRKFIDQHLMEGLGLKKNIFYKRINSTINHIARAKTYIEANIDDIISKAVKIYNEGYAEIDLEYIKNLSEELYLRLLTKTLCSIGGKVYRPRYESLYNLYSDIITADRKLERTLSGCKIFIRTNNSLKKKLLVVREVPKYEMLSDLKSSKPTLWDNRFEVTFVGKQNPPQVRHLGKKAWQEIVAVNQFIKENVNFYSEVIYSLPAFIVNDEVVAVPHLGYYKQKELENSIKLKFKAASVNSKNIEIKDI